MAKSGLERACSRAGPCQSHRDSNPAISRLPTQPEARPDRALRKLSEARQGSAGGRPAYRDRARVGRGPGARPAPGSADDHQQDVKDEAQHKAYEVKDQAEEKVKPVRQAAPDQVRQAISTIHDKARENPLPFAGGGGLVAGFLLGRTIRRP
jgi:ElaB/YqjD/DUF883 family membrane-anchored ribosome-binding protein